MMQFKFIQGQLPVRYLHLHLNLPLLIISLLIVLKIEVKLSFKILSLIMCELCFTKVT